MRNLLLLVMAVVLVGCAGSTFATAPIAEKNRKLMLKLNVGMSKSDVQGIMGDPHDTETYSIAGGVHEIWFYRTRDTGFSEARQFTPFAFKDGKLEGWGRNYYDDVIKIRKEIIKKDN